MINKLSIILGIFILFITTINIVYAYKFEEGNKFVFYIPNFFIGLLLIIYPIVMFIVTK